MLSLENKGFTLIELLIVIVIIGFLSTMIMINMGVAISKGRDARRVSDLKQMATALELYYQENNSYPPLTDADVVSKCSGPNEWSTDTCWKHFIPKKFIPLVPRDPKGAGGIPSGKVAADCERNAICYIYRYCNIDNTRFVVVANLENVPKESLGNPASIYEGCITGGPNWFWVGN